MKIFFNRIPRNEPYGGGSHFVTFMVEKLREDGHEVVFDLTENVDLIFIIDPRPGDKGYSINHALQYRERFPKTKILYRVNECDARKNTSFMDNIISETIQRVDGVIFISNWLKSYFINKGVENIKDSPVIYNGCNLNHFYPEDKSNQKLKLVTHHWSDNWLKGFDLYQAIDEYLENNDDFEFTYVGRYSSLYNPKNTQLVSPLHGKLLGDEIRKHDIYVTASRYEPCGMHHIEGACSGLPVLYHSDGGGIVEGCIKHGEPFSDFEEFLVKLNLIRQNILEYRDRIDYKALSMESCRSSFAREINKMIT